MTYGLDLEAALGNLRERSGLNELSFLIVAISIQTRSGGNLAEILTNLARMVRDRAKMRRKIKSLSSEGRMSAIMLSIIPIALALILNLMNPDFYGEVSNEPFFVTGIAIAGMLWVIGVFVLYRMVNFKV